MARLAERDYTYFTTVRGMCRGCRRIVPARVFFRDGQVWQESLCASCHNTPAMIAASQEWYLANVVQPMRDRSPLPGAKPPEQGCPHDCGPCTWHASPCQLPVIVINSDCNLGCPICFTYNRNDPPYRISIEAMQRTVDWIVESSAGGRSDQNPPGRNPSGRGVDLVNLTGGEPTLHPQILELLRLCRRPEIGMVTINSNGLRMAEDYAFCEQLAELGIYVVLSLNTFDPEVGKRLHGRDVTGLKLQAMENLDKAGVKMSVLHVMIRDLTEGAIGRILDLLRNTDHVLNLTIQTMTYTGQGGAGFHKGQHIPVDEAAQIVCRESGGVIELEDFVSRPLAHPLCYQSCYMLRSGRQLVPLTRLASREQIEQLFQDSYLVRPEQGREFLTDAINGLYADGRTEHLGVLRELVERMYPAGKAITDFQRQRIAESFVRTVTVHAHMDEDTFDCSRAMLCGDLVPTEPGRLVPDCTYNLFHRNQDQRFNVPSEG